MSYQVLARKWRPQSFSDVVGQEHVLKGLIHALDHNRLHHAYLFTGTRGVGKTTLARILAACLNCEKGVSATPCGQCEACREISEGRFVDLIEVDAASRTKVEDTREILDNVQYAPTKGRFKVYLIDEVHMLSTHSFNALLKTLEEPPEHVKFLLATTDPQKLPVTVLSRCLQFHLKHLTITQITGHLAYILKEEKIKCEAGALAAIARAGEGSMRDALSLLDQAIAYGNGQVEQEAVQKMLGVAGEVLLFELIAAIMDKDVTKVMENSQAFADSLLSYSGLLDDMARVFYQVALLQQLPKLSAVEFDVEKLTELANRLLPEQVQLYYQICITSRRDLPLAPDLKTGFEMAMLRLVAFEKVTMASSVKPVETKPPQVARPALKQVPKQAPVATKPPKVIVQAQPKTAPVSTTKANVDWSAWLAAMPLKGMARQLAQHCELVSHDDKSVTLALASGHASLLNDRVKDKLEVALRAYLNTSVKLHFQAKEKPLGNTPAKQAAVATQEKQNSAEQAILADPNIQFMQAEFNAIIEPDSIKPIDNKGA